MHSFIHLLVEEVEDNNLMLLQIDLWEGQSSSWHWRQQYLNREHFPQLDKFLSIFPHLAQTNEGPLLLVLLLLLLLLLLIVSPLVLVVFVSVVVAGNGGRSSLLGNWSVPNNSVYPTACCLSHSP